MNDWVLWLIMAGVLVVLEMFTGTFYLLMIAIGLGFGALAALFGMSVPAQTIVAAVVGVIATGVLHRSRFGHPAKQNPARDHNVNIDIGQRLTVAEWQGGKARVMYRGALWDVELGQGAIAEAGSFKIVEVQGNRLIVANS
ncbi:NfeD family protein [Massilia sp. GCM10020059]|uniref:NfeD family protein n=1 Tax=Massilia agrisoli TaxID=2892444 RepID=A0ABS8ITI0_9BURK|nr:NfeD family protein [Massilia agrisoli]MCC6071038.1 NfeD family protein [Massilia agrisoli]